MDKSTGRRCFFPILIALGALAAWPAAAQDAAWPSKAVRFIVPFPPGGTTDPLARAIPGAKLVIPHGGGHAFSKTRPEEYNRIVSDFLGAAG